MQDNHIGRQHHSSFFYQACLSLSVLQKCHIFIKPGWQWQPSVPGYVWALPARFSCSVLSMHCNNRCLCPQLETNNHLTPIFAQQRWFCEQRGNDATRRKEKPKEEKISHFFQRSWESETSDYFCFPKCVINFKHFKIISVVLFWKDIAELSQ